jgi:hypothetical protein
MCGLLEPKDPWYWLGISAGLAQALGLHQASVPTLLQDVLALLIYSLANHTCASMKESEDCGGDCGG